MPLLATRRPCPSQPAGKEGGREEGRAEAMEEDPDHCILFEVGLFRRVYRGTEEVNYCRVVKEGEDEAKRWKDSRRGGEENSVRKKDIH